MDPFENEELEVSPQKETVEETLPEEQAYEEPERMTFEVYTEEQPQPQPQPAEAVHKPKKEKKNVGFWILAALLAVSLILQTVSMIGSGKDATLQGASINEKGELIITYSDGRTENLGTVVGKDGADSTDGTTTVLPGEYSQTVSITNALRSSVSVFCTFTQDNRWGALIGQDKVTEYYSAGSGVIYQLNKSTGDAIIITNHHVVFDAESSAENGIAEKINVYLYGSEMNGKELEATYVGGSMYYDLAVLQIKGSELLKDSDVTSVTVANSDDVQVGSTAIAVGNAEGSGISTTFGVVSIPSEYITMTAADGKSTVDYRVMRVDAAVNSGNSGGGLFDNKGNLIGIVNAKTVVSGVENIGYALPSAVVVAVVDNILDYCLGTDCENVMRPILGVTVQVMDSRADYDEATGSLSIVETVQVQSVDAKQLGKVFRVGDVLVSATIHGETKPLTRQYHLIDLLVTARVGDTVDFVVLRDGKETKLTVTIDESCLTAY